jgi:hypothetical protein
MDQGWFIRLSVLLCVLSTGCGKGDGKWKSFPVEIYADPSVVSDEESNRDFQEAMAFWEEKAGKKLFDYKGVWRGGSPYAGDAQQPGDAIANVVFHQMPWPFSQRVAGQTTIFEEDGFIQSALVMLNPDLEFCTGSCVGARNLTSHRNTLAHELGHFIGLEHVQDEANIMFPTVLEESSLERVTVDLSALQKKTTTE